MCTLALHVELLVSLLTISLTCHVKVWMLPRECFQLINEMQIIFNVLLGSSDPVPVMPVGGNKMYCALLWE